MARSMLPAVASLAAVLGAGMAVLSILELGTLSAHMAVHILLMNVAAPLLAVVCSRHFPTVSDRGALLWAATAIQLALLWVWHAPPLHHAAMYSPILQGFMHVTLLLAAALFWTLLLGLAAKARWQAILPLLLTAKLSCLPGALLVFAPRHLYAAHHHLHPAIADLGDQQLAGLLMITACPLSYVIAGVVVAAQAIAELGRGSGSSAAASRAGNANAASAA
jgi:putative membrane protein